MADTVLIPCKPYEVDRYNLDTDLVEKCTVNGYRVRLRDTLPSHCGANGVQLENGQWLVVSPNNEKQGAAE